MKRKLQSLIPLAAFVLIAAGCPAPTPDTVTHAFTMSDPDIELVWGITIFQEEPCGGGEFAGGEVDGEATFGELGGLTVAMSSAWDIGNLLEEDEKEFEPDSPAAAGPAAPVLGQDDYPHQFEFNPFTGDCLEPGETPASATGQVRFAADNGDELHGLVTGGETHRLDFVVEGDGIETFNIIEFDGGTGEFSRATGSFVVHTILRFDHDAEEFVIDLVEVLPGGTITY